MTVPQIVAVETIERVLQPQTFVKVDASSEALAVALETRQLATQLRVMAWWIIGLGLLALAAATVAASFAGWLYMNL